MKKMQISFFWITSMPMLETQVNDIDWHWPEQGFIFNSSQSDQYYVHNVLLGIIFDTKYKLKS